MPKVSVIIPTFNREKFVTKAIDSVLNQSYKDYEIIVIDDGSTDNTRDILQRYEKRIRYIYQANAGVSAARNAGIRCAEGEWLAFLDSDDEWRQDYLSWQMSQARQHQEIVAHFTNAVTIYHDGNAAETYFDERTLLSKFGGKTWLILERPLRTVLEHPHWFLQSCVMKRDLVNTVGLFDVRLSIAEDLDLIARLALMGPFRFCNEIMAEVHRRKESMTNLGSLLVREGVYSCEAFGTVYRKLIKEKRLTKMEMETLKKKLSINRKRLGNIFLWHRKKIEARKYYRSALLNYPSLKSLLKYLATFLPHKIAPVVVRRGREIQLGTNEMRQKINSSLE